MALVITNAAPTDKLNALKADVNIIARGKLVFLTILYVQVGYSKSSRGYTDPYTLYSAGTYYPMFKIPKNMHQNQEKQLGSLANTLRRKQRIATISMSHKSMILVWFQ